MKRIIEKRGPRQKSLQNQNGQALIFITLAFVVLGMFIGLAVDGGRAYLMRERLRKIVDAASLAGAKAMASVTGGGDAKAAAVTAACQSAMINGMSEEDCLNAEKLAIEVGEVTNPDGSIQQGVIVTGFDTGRTFFMALGGFIGCESCKSINVVARGQAAPDTLADIVLVMDDTGTMACAPPADCPIEQAKAGANELVSMVLTDPNSHAQIAFVPFRGCYASGLDRYFPPALRPDTSGGLAGCILFSDVQDLTNDMSALTQKINARHADGGYPGTNVCLGMHEGRKKLFGDQSRRIARKIMIVLTDGDQGYSDLANGGFPTNLGNPTPLPYATGAYTLPGGQSGYDAGKEPYDAAHAISGSGMAPNPPGDPVPGGFGASYDPAVYALDGFANAKASTMKQTDPSGLNVEIYVLRFALPAGDNLTSGTCDPALISNTSVPRGTYVPKSNDPRDQNLSRCLASNTSMGDPFAKAPNDHYFYAATAAAIKTQFQAIAADILRKRRLVG